MAKVKVKAAEKKVVETSYIIPSISKYGKTAVFVDHTGTDYKKNITPDEYAVLKGKVLIYKNKVEEGRAERTLSRYLEPIKKMLLVETEKKKVNKENLKVAAKKVKKKIDKKRQGEKSDLYSTLIKIDTNKIDKEEENTLLSLAAEINRKNSPSVTSKDSRPGE
jgi:hypothetical protein